MLIFVPCVWLESLHGLLTCKVHSVHLKKLVQLLELSVLRSELCNDANRVGDDTGLVSLYVLAWV